MAKRMIRIYAEVGKKFHKQVRVMSAHRSMTMRQYVLEAVGKQLYDDQCLLRSPDDKPHQSSIIDSGEGF